MKKSDSKFFFQGGKQADLIHFSCFKKKIAPIFCSKFPKLLNQAQFQEKYKNHHTVRPATALTSLALNLILHYFELVPELLLQHYFLRLYLPFTALF